MGIFEDNADLALGEDNTLQDLERAAGALDDNETVVETLVGEGKKFKTVEALAKGKILSDAFIERLISEKRQLEKELQERKRIEDFMTEIKNLAPGREEPSNGGNNAAERDPSENGALDPQALTEQILRAIEEKNRASIAEQNVKKVKDALSNTFGQSWLKSLEDFSNANGMSRELIDNWVKTNPDAVIQAVTKFQAPNSSPVVNPPPSRMNVPMGSSVPNAGGLNKYSDFKKVLKTDPNRYYSREFQVLMHDTAVKMGDAFFTS